MFKIIAFFIITLFDQLYVTVGILLQCEPYHIREEVYVHKTSLIPPLFTEVPIPSQESESHVFVCLSCQFCLFL